MLFYPFLGLPYSFYAYKDCKFHKVHIMTPVPRDCAFHWGIKQTSVVVAVAWHTLKIRLASVLVGNRTVQTVQTMCFVHDVGVLSIFPETETMSFACLMVFGGVSLVSPMSLIVYFLVLPVWLFHGGCSSSPASMVMRTFQNGDTNLKHNEKINQPKCGYESLTTNWLVDQPNNQNV